MVGLPVQQLDMFTDFMREIVASCCSIDDSAKPCLSASLSNSSWPSTTRELPSASCSRQTTAAVIQPVRKMGQAFKNRRVLAGRTQTRNLARPHAFAGMPVTMRQVSGYRNVERLIGQMLILHGIVRAEYFNLGMVRLAQLAQAILVGQPGVAILFHHGLVKAQAGRAPGIACIHFLVIKIRVACLQQPAFGSPDGNARMAMGMAGQRHHKDLGRKPIQVAEPNQRSPPPA